MPADGSLPFQKSVLPPQSPENGLGTAAPGRSRVYGEKEKAAKAVEYKHMTFYEAAQLAKDARVKEMWLTHYSPSMTRAEVYMDEVRKISPFCRNRQYF